MSLYTINIAQKINNKYSHQTIIRKIILISNYKIVYLELDKQNSNINL